MEMLDLIRIMQFGDSVLPIGAFSFSNGLESAIQIKVVHDVATLQQFVEDSVNQAAHCDAMALAVAHQAVTDNDQALIIKADWAINNRKPNEESRLMTARMGKKLAEMATAIIDHPLLHWWLTQIKSGTVTGTHPITLALIMAVQGIEVRQVLVMHQYGVTMTLLSAAIRLMRVSHIETQRILFEITRTIDQQCDIAEQGSLEQMASYTPIIDILAAVHVNAHVRLFMN